MPFERRLEGRRVGVAGDADGAGDFLRARLVEGFEHAAARLDRHQVPGIARGMNMQDIQMIDTLSPVRPKGRVGRRSRAGDASTGPATRPAATV